MSYFSSSLPNGIRIIHKQDFSPVSYCGIAINVGTRDEEENEQGMAHFIEHMLFKGTQKRKSWHILNRLETIGGSIDAYTTKEETFFYTAIPTEHYERAVELLSDILFHSTFPQKEIEKEVEVVLDEIQSYKDSPSELIYDCFEEIIFKQSSLGRNILGNEQQLKSFTTKDLKQFIQRNYHPEKILFFSMGNIEFKKVYRLSEKYLSENPSWNTNNRRLPLAYECQTERQKRETFQTHCMIGNRAYEMKNERRLGLFLLNNILGGPSMNSLLNLSIREKNGLAYTIDSEITSYSDTGVFSIYFGCDPKNSGRCLNLVEKELKKLREKPLCNRQLKVFKRQLTGQLMIASQNRENFVLNMAKSFLHFNAFDQLEQTQAKIEKINEEELLSIANEIFNPHELSYLFFE